MDELMGISEIAEFTGLAKNTVKHYHYKGLLPPHDYETARQKLWLPATIEGWARERRAGRFKHPVYRETS